MRSFPLSLARASSDTRTSVFLSFLLLAHIGQLFISNAFKFVAFELTGSASIVSLVGSVSAIAFITLGVFSGIIVDAFSRSFFAVFHLLTFAVLSLIFYAVYENGLASIYLLFGFILLHETSSSFSKGANNTIFFDLCGTERLSRWISWRSIVFTVGSMASSLLLTVFASSESSLFVVYSFILMAAYAVFLTIGYNDQNQRQDFGSITEALHFVWGRFRDFLLVCRARPALFFLFVFSFIKTTFVFWPMASGALLKFGIEENETRRLYLIAMVLMDLVSIASLYALGLKVSFTNRTFIIGAWVSGLGILLFSLVDGFVLSVATLSLMYVGLAVSQVSSSYILRVELPEDHRTQGLSFAVVPYYLADIVSGVVFALLLTAFSVPHLLLAAGGGLIAICTVAFFFARRA